MKKLLFCLFTLLLLLPGMYGNFIQAMAYFSELTFDSGGNWILEIKVYPNPTADLLFIKGGNLACLSILDITGCPVFSESEFSGGAIDVSFLTEGIYFILIQTSSDQCYIQKLVVN
jgi:hypothetical protein